MSNFPTIYGRGSMLNMIMQLGSQEDMGCINIWRICRLIAIGIWRDKVLYEKSGCSIVRKLRYPNNFSSSALHE